MHKPHVVIIGSGFGGIEVAKRLRGAVHAGFINLTVIDRANAFLFTPLLHEAATGGLDGTSIAQPIREVFVRSGVRIVQANVTAIDVATHTLVTDEGRIGYDLAVLATGARTNFLAVPGAERFALPLKTLRDALAIRERVIAAFEAAAMCDDVQTRRSLLSFVVVGGGATGVELAAELAEFTSGIANRYFADGKNRITDDDVTVTLASATAEVLPQFASFTRTAAQRRLEFLRVHVRAATQVTNVGKDAVTFSDGSVSPSSLVVWTAGVIASVPEILGAEPTFAKGRVVVDGVLRVQGVPNLFALGDVAVSADEPLPMLAQVAAAQGKVLAKNILATVAATPPQPFVYLSKGALVSLGQWYAAGNIGIASFSGRVTWWVWRTVYPAKFASMKKRLLIAFDWTLNLFLPRDITRLT